MTKSTTKIGVIKSQQRCNSITPIVDVYYTHSRCHLLRMQWNCKDSSVKQKKDNMIYIPTSLIN